MTPHEKALARLVELQNMPNRDALDTYLMDILHCKVVLGRAGIDVNDPLESRPSST